MLSGTQFLKIKMAC